MLLCDCVPFLAKFVHVKVYCRFNPPPPKKKVFRQVNDWSFQTIVVPQWSQPLDCSTLWNFGNYMPVGTASLYRVTSFWYVTRSRISSTLSRYGVPLHGNVTSVDPPLQRRRRHMIHRLSCAVPLENILQLDNCFYLPLSTWHNTQHVVRTFDLGCWLITVLAHIRCHTCCQVTKCVHNYLLQGAEFLRN